MTKKQSIQRVYLDSSSVSKIESGNVLLKLKYGKSIMLYLTQEKPNCWCLKQDNLSICIYAENKLDLPSLLDEELVYLWKKYVKHTEGEVVDDNNIGQKLLDIFEESKKS